MTDFLRFRIVLALAALLLASSALAEVMDRPTGIRIGQRMTLRPYVGLSVGWDSNPKQTHSGARGDVLWTINPGFGIDYKAENWTLRLNAFYNYRSYTRDDVINDRNRHSFGEDLDWSWSNIDGSGKGWSLRLSEFFQQINMADDISYGGGKSYNGDRREFNVQGLVERRFNERVHLNLDAHYYKLIYDNDTNVGYANYGWDRWTAGLQGGYVLSKWTDILLSGNYQGYQQENTGNYSMSGQSQGFSAQAGIGTHATERITYRLLAGWSRFEYADGSQNNDGFAYTAAGNWMVSETLQTMLVANSYYQPSERDIASSTRVDSFSWGVAKTMVRGKLRGTFDVMYRREYHDMAGGTLRAGNDYTLDILSARLGCNYVLNRFLTLFAYGEYMRSWNTESERDNGRWDYDRWRATLGLKFTY